MTSRDEFLSDRDDTMRGDSDTGGEHTVCAAPILSPSTWENLVETWRGLDVPEGRRAEIIEERIVMTPPSGNGHNPIAERSTALW